ncbi:MAG TPA: hypothetical protein VEU96_12200 [Bryobacteraceae bacterium]|nr:hypothetical protein [Bryobacteraceae bacterium]
MFFRRETPHIYTFAERMEGLKKLGLAVKALDSKRAQVSRDGIGAVVEDRGGAHVHVNGAGLITGDELGLLVNGGYQMFWKTPTGKRVPAQAKQLRALHNFGEDLKEGLDLPSLYNEGLGTTSDLHMYDRVEHRDAGDSHKPWEQK